MVCFLVGYFFNRVVEFSFCCYGVLMSYKYGEIVVYGYNFSLLRFYWCCVYVL